MAAAFHTLRLLADDLTGALDSAVGFVRAFAPLEVGLESLEGGSQVLNSATRELPAREATARVAALAPMLAAKPGQLSFFKVDSLLRGHAGAELATVLATNSYARVILAPALPAQGRATENGRQIVQGIATGEDLAATLSGEGHALTLRPPGPPAEGITLFDAETDADLDRIVEEALRLPGETLWVGTGGLAAALGRMLPAKAKLPALPPKLPLLGFVGTDHPVMQEQLAGMRHLPIPAGSPDREALRNIQFALVDHGSVFVTCDLPAGLPHGEAHRQISQTFAESLAQLPRPGTLFASGGETLRALLAPLGARGLRVETEFLPGMPLSVIVGGRWSGLPVLSKSGAFGAPDLLETLIGKLRHAGKVFVS
ncbi:MAG: Hrp-dependent type III effector protein [Beijerinckiaceae bacterium]|nr:Hrp-dependent type III effector protein [Beijerinckiaceae bacterium]